MSEFTDIKSLGKKMDKSIDSLNGELNSVRTGRASPSLLDHVHADSYGADTPIAQLATITVEEGRTLLINVWDKNNVAAIEKAIATSDLGLNPAVQGTIIRIAMPPLTEERRNDLIKVVRQQGEAAKVAIRNIRRDAIKSVKNSEASQDEEKSIDAAIDKLTATKTQEVDQILSAKEKELSTI